ncbi:MAG TPA: hypothetical protein PLL71_02445 [Agriterribacter sp.]|nr:hypothetical protein [Agriterribacter sp.]HRQ49023.1 hypothetical protein [Agriterribacter sp.]
MGKIIHVNLCGRIIRIPEDAWKKYLNYIETLYAYFRREQDHFEIINDIESRIAELMLEEMNNKCSVVSQQDMDNIIARIGTVTAFEALDNDDWEISYAELSRNNTSNNINTAMHVFLSDNTLTTQRKCRMSSN